MLRCLLFEGRKSTQTFASPPRYALSPQQLTILRYAVVRYASEIKDKPLTVVAWFMRLISTKHVCTIESLGDCMLCHLRLGDLKTGSDAPRRHHAGVMSRGLSSLPVSSIPRLAV